MSDNTKDTRDDRRRDSGGMPTRSAAGGQQPDMVVAFRGLCSLIKRADKYEAYLLTGEIFPNDFCGMTKVPMTHTGRLTIAVPDIDIVNTDWPPTFIVYHDGVQVGCWDISGKQIEFRTGDDQALQGLPRWTNRHRSIDFRAEHGLDAQGRSTLTGYGYGVLDLLSGSIRCAEDETIDVCRDSANCKTRDVSQQIDWLPNSGEGLIVRYSDAAGNHSIIVKRPTTLTVTNAAAPAVMQNTGAPHFAFYYTMFAKPPLCADRITLAPPSYIRFASPDVYDCVPPIPGS